MIRIDRTADRVAVEALLEWNPIVAILGARQVGKSTLARDVVAAVGGSATVFDLEDPAQLNRLADPMTALRDLTGLIVLDEIQRRPEIFPVLRVLADREGPPARFLVLGSASPELLRQSSESLAGRIAFHRLGPLALDEVGVSRRDRLWFRGGFPRSFLARNDVESAKWRRDFISTFLERDLPQLGVRTPAATLDRFWSMLAHYHGQTWNAAELARAFGVGETAVRRYLELLAGTFVVRVLPPWSENLAKRQVRAPKVYIADTGLLHSLLGIETLDGLERHPKVGASWEGFAIGAVARRLGAREDQCYCWATHQNAELDLLVVDGDRRLGFEVKRTVAPAVTKSMHVALADLRLDRLDVIHAGDDTYPLTGKIRAVALRRVLDDVAPLR
ncbi:MAG: ATP-binding protein [Planctomycetes bacterium]|nr:ATP-binding protein [Planctomycetota bacterium]